MLSPDPKETQALNKKLKKIEKKNKSKSLQTPVAPNFHKRTEMKHPTDKEACQACDYNCCCEMLRLAVKKQGGKKDNYVISGKLHVYRGSELVAWGEISV